ARPSPGGWSVADAPAGAPLRRGEGGGGGGAAHRLQPQVGARAAGQPHDLGSEVSGAGVDDVVGAQRPYHHVLARRGRGDHRRAVVLGHLDRGLAGPTGRGVDQHGLPSGDATQRLERRQRGRPAHDQAQPLLVGPARPGGGPAAAAGSTTYWAKAPPPMPAPMTWAPAARSITPSPTAVTSPAPSMPAKYGGCGPPANVPRACEMSTKLTPAAVT